MSQIDNKQVILKNDKDDELVDDIETHDEQLNEQEIQQLTRDNSLNNKNGLQHKSNPIGRFMAWYGRHKKWAIFLTILLGIGATFAIPWSRYYILSKLVEKSYTVELMDTKTNAPISGATLSIEGNKTLTDAKGKATLQARVGKRNLEIDKKYYITYTQHVFVGLATQKSDDQVRLVATGRQVPVAVVNKITGKPLQNVMLDAVGTKVVTDKDGKATIVLPANQATLSGTLTAKGYNDAKVTIQVIESVVKDNDFQLVPTGKLYFLSKLSGKIDVVKTDLDGSNRETVVAGSGKEEEGNTVLLASRDWKYLALQSKRDSTPAKLYLIDTGTDKMTTMDEGDAVFSLAGWSNHVFAYSLARNKVQPWEPNRLAVKTYDADKKQILTIDQNEADGRASDYESQALESFYLLGDKLVYNTRWFSVTLNDDTQLANKTNSIREATVGTTLKKDVKIFPVNQYYVQRVVVVGPQELYYDFYNPADSNEQYFEYDDGTVNQVNAADQQKITDNTVYPTYLTSPQDDKTFWSEQRDGRDTFFVGDADGQNGKQLAVLDDYKVYGWYTDDYLLVSKKDSELYILPAIGGTPLKVTDYHKPKLSYAGYGGGYGGL